MNITDVIAILDKEVVNPQMGLPEEVFYFISRMTPLVNVDLLIKDENKRTLLAWRDDKFAGKGWHLPGGIIRFKETLEARIKKVAETEIGAEIEFDQVPLDINQIICDCDTRGHFISILYKCFLSSKFIPQNKGLSEKAPGYLRWHDKCPNDLLKPQDIYMKYI